MSEEQDFGVISSVYKDEHGLNWLTVMCPVWWTLPDNLEASLKQMEGAVREWYASQELELSEVPCDEGAGQNGTHEEAQPSEQETSGDQSRYGEPEA